jgi:UDP-N-acetylglucosamine--N-acetylmuramyl-(pentapeptide) pyrophosphoryl-undecaprenol N-acetylglucosamine transferase
MLVGGGSGGHLTPLLAVAKAIKSHNPSTIVVHVGQKNENLHDVVGGADIDETYSITAGKFRRYHGSSFLSHMLDIKTIILNIRDAFRFVIGTFQAWRLLGRVKPDSIMLKGGFVCVPVGYAARIRGIPYITHDSDAVPGLANRMTAKNAVYNTTALPADIYQYDQAKTIQVGIPIREEFTEVTPDILRESKQNLSINTDAPVLFVVGGGLGAQMINTAITSVSPDLLEQNKSLIIIHVTGKKLFDDTKQLYSNVLNEAQMKSVKLIDFTAELFRYSAAADVVLTRGGATNIAEFAAQAKACIVVPAPHLTGGQQLHNAKVLQDVGAAVIVQEENVSSLGDELSKLLQTTAQDREALGQKLHSLAIYDSADKLATLLLEIANNGVNKS